MSYYKRGNSYSVYVPTREGGRIVRAAGTRDKSVVRQMDSMLRRLASKRDWLFLDGIVAGRLTVGELFDSDVRNDLEALRARLNDIDVAQFIEPWSDAVRARTSTTSDTAQQYVTKLRSLVPEGGTLLRSELTYPRLTAGFHSSP